MQLAFVQHSRLEPFVNRPAQHAVAYPQVQEAPKQFVIKAVEESFDVDIQEPATTHLH